MKLRNFLKTGLLSLLAIGGGSTIKTSINQPIVAKAELSWSDPSSSEFSNGWTYDNYASYYTNYSTLATGSGSALKTKLYNIIKSPSVTSYAGLWTAYQTTDLRSDGKIWDMYSSTTNFTYSTNQCGSYKAEGGCYNREHSLPKSWFSEATPMYSDIVHLVPTDGYVNNRRGNNPFGEVTSPTYSSNEGFSKLGPNSFSGSGGGTAFEPNDEYKGDFARIYFYMVTAYENVVANWTSSSTNLGGTSYPGLNSWSTEMLLKWSINDPISAKEIARNNGIQSTQGNRNPYVDNSTFACRVFGPYNDATKALCQSQNAVGANGVSLNTSSQSITIGGTYQLTATVSPNDATNKDVTWSTGNSSVATVSNTGLVTAVDVGSTTITVTTDDGGYTATCSITVNPISVSSVSLNINSTTLQAGDSLQLTATVSPANATNKNVTWSSDAPGVASVNSSGFVLANSAGSANITVTTSDGSKTATCAITVTAVSTTIPEVISKINTAKSDFATVRSTPNDLTDLKALIDDASDNYDELSSQKQANVTNSAYISVMNEVVDYLETKWYGVVRIKITVSRNVKRVESEEWSICECISDNEKTTTALSNYDALSSTAKTLLDETYDITASDGTDITIGQSIRFIANSAEANQEQNNNAPTASLTIKSYKPYMVIGAIALVAISGVSLEIYSLLRKKER